MSWEDMFTAWSKGPGTTENTKCENAESVISSMLKTNDALATLPLRVFTQGSYKARTNVRQDSDVDICVLRTDAFFYDLAPGLTPDPTASFSASKLSFGGFKDLVHAALLNELGSSGVTRGSKAFDVHANTYRIDADVVPALEYRFYFDATTWRTGVAFLTDSGIKIFNYPEQTHENGVAKNARTAKTYKRTIRILKRLRNRMQEENIPAAHDIGSFLIESLVWNVTDDAFGHDTYTSVVQNVLAHGFNSTLNDADCQDWYEVNGCKYLFRPSQPWTRPQAHAFLGAAWDHIGYQ